jgi:hypothetical protein
MPKRTLSPSQHRRIEKQRKIEQERIKAARDHHVQTGAAITEPEQLADEVQRLADVLGARVKETSK